MRVEITDDKPGLSTLHHDHMLFDAYDMHIIAMACGILVCLLVIICTCFRLRRSRNDPANMVDRKKRE
jgi:hypothetical protein